MYIVLWNGFHNRLEVFRGDEDAAQRFAKLFLEDGSDVIYFYALIESITLKED